MNKAKHFTLPEVFNNTKIGFTFEFFSSKDIKFIVENLGDLTTKNVIITNSESYEPSYSSAILIKEYDGKKPKYSFKMAQQRYDSSMPLMKEVLKWISETSECNNNTNLRVNISFDHGHLDTLKSISKMNPQKLILKFNEEFIYERFPDQEHSPFSISIKQLLPISDINYSQNIVKNVNYIIGVPDKSYYGVNFENYTRDILEFNYIGGYDYSEKEKEIQEVIEYYVLMTYQSINENEFNKEEIRELKKLTNDFYKIQEGYDNHESFLELFPDIKIAIDLRRDSQLLKTYWTKIRNNLFECVINHNLRKGEFNYDVEYGMFQLKNADLICNNLKGYDLIKCNISGILESCNMISCNIEHARIYNSIIYSGNKINESYLKYTVIQNENKLENSFVENNYQLINCNIKNSIIKFPALGKSAKIDEDTVIIDKQENLIDQQSLGIEVEELRDYTWVKNLTGKKSDDHVFGNEYKKQRKFI